MNDNQTKAISNTRHSRQLLIMSLVIFFSIYVQNEYFLYMILFLSSFFIIKNPIYLGIPLYWIFVFSTQYYIVGNASIARILGIIIIIGLLIKILQSRTSIRFDKTIFMIIFLSLLAFVSVLYSVDLSSSISNFFVLLINIIIFLLIYFSNFSFYKLLKLLYYASILSVLFALFLVLVNSNLLADLFNGNLSRISMDNDQNPGEFGRNLFIVFSLILFYFGKFSNTNKKFLIYLLLFVTFILIFLSGSRTSFVSSIIVVLIFSISRKNVSIIKMMTGIMTLALLTWLSFKILGSSIDIILSRFSIDYIIDTQGARRFTLWKLYLDYVIPNHLFFGVGIGGTAEVIALQKYYPTVSYIYLKPAHNMFLELIIQFGIFGFSLFMAFFANIFMKYIKLRKCEKEIKYGLVIIFLCLILMSIGEPMFFSKPFWIVISLISAITHKKGVEYENNETYPLYDH